MFRGASKITLDAKGRMAMPTRYRDRLSEKSDGRLVVTVDRDYCLLIYPFPDWEEIERKLVRLPSLIAAAGQDLQTDLGPMEIGGLITAMATTRFDAERLSGRPFDLNGISYWEADWPPRDVEAINATTIDGDNRQRFLF